MNISEFLNNEYSDFALYSNYRAHPSYIDGLKNSGRKLVYTIRKKNIKSTLKVTALTSEVVKASGYLHGDASMNGTIVTRAQSFSGANNLPILTGKVLLEQDLFQKRLLLDIFLPDPLITLISFLLKLMTRI